MKLVPCTYIAEHPVTLFTHGGPYFDADGKQFTEKILQKGRTLMLPEYEAYGYTVLHDPRREQEPKILGNGRVVLDEHKHLPDAELHAIGYQFHQPRQDFMPLVAQTSEQPTRKSAAKKENEQS